MTFKFKKGERVMFYADEKYRKDASIRKWDGSQGIVVDNRGGSWSGRIVDVLWDEGSGFHLDMKRRSGDHNECNIHAAELPYDPTQQGDRDDDI